MKTAELPESKLASYRADGATLDRMARQVLIALCRRRGIKIPPDDWQDIVQDVLVTTCERLQSTADTLDEKGVYRIIWDSARNVMQCRRSAAQHRIKYGVLEFGEDIPEGLYSDSEVDSLLRIVDILPTSLQSTAVELAVYHLPTTRELADCRGIGQTTVMRHIAKLRGIMADRIPECHIDRAIREAADELLSDDWTPYTTAPDRETTAPETTAPETVWYVSPGFFKNDTADEIQLTGWFDDMVTTVRTNDNGHLETDTRYRPNVWEGILAGLESIYRDPSIGRQRQDTAEVFRAVDPRADRYPGQPSRRGLSNRAPMLGDCRSSSPRCWRAIRSGSTFCR